MNSKKYLLHDIYFYLTKGCNLCCRHCWIKPNFQTEDKQYPSLDLGLFKSILEQAKPLGLYGVKLTGGEPLLHPQIREILECVKLHDLRLSMETNGVLCTQELAKKITQCKNPFVAVSLDATDEKTHEWIRGVKGCFSAAKEGLTYLKEAGLRPQIIMTIMRCNHKQLEAMVRFAETIGAGSVKFNIVQPTARGEEMHHKGETLDIQELISLGGWVENSLSTQTALPLFYSHPVAFRSLGNMYGERARGCGICSIFSILGVLADGRYALCGIGETVPELIFSDARKEPLKEVWENTPLLQALRAGLPRRLEGICADCIMKGRCLGSCVAQNYYTTKNIWAGFWYCEQADKKGLFPITRKHSGLNGITERAISG